MRLLKGTSGASRATPSRGSLARPGASEYQRTTRISGRTKSSLPACQPASQHARARASSPAHPPMAAATMIMRAHGGGGTLTARVYRTCRPPKSQPLPVRSTRWVARARPSSIDRGKSLAGTGRAVPAGRGAGPDAFILKITILNLRQRRVNLIRVRVPYASSARPEDGIIFPNFAVRAGSHYNHQRRSLSKLKVHLNSMIHHHSSRYAPGSAA